MDPNWAASLSQGYSGGGAKRPTPTFLQAGYTNQNPFYNPQAKYGLESETLGYTGVNDYVNTEWGNLDASNESPVASYMRFLGDYNPNSGRGRFLEGQYQRLAQGYQQARLTNPELWFQEYLQQPDLRGRLERAYQLASYDEQGRQPGRFAPSSRLMARG